MKNFRTIKILLITLLMLLTFLFVGSHRGEDFLYMKSIPVVVSELLKLSYALENFKQKTGRYPTHKENLQILLSPPDWPQHSLFTNRNIRVETGSDQGCLGYSIYLSLSSSVWN